jgi:glycolate oxidase FAD binding subunit
MTVRPTDLDQLQQAVRQHDCVIPLGAQTVPTLSRVSRAVTRLDMTGLAGVTEYDPSEFVISAQAGTTIIEIQQELEKNGQYLPFDPPWVEAGATLGGTVAAGLSGPGRLRYGGVRDFLIGIRFVDGEGKLIRGGGKVVKNSAGFDLAKLMVGSQGRLGVLAEVTFKVFPQPRQRATMTVTCRDLADALRTLAQLAGAPWDLDALELEPPATLVIRIAGHAESLPARVQALGNALDCPTECMSSEREMEYWRSVNEFAWRVDDATLVKVPLTGARIPELEDTIAACSAPRRYSVAGNVAWLAWPREQPIDHLHACLSDMQLPGLVLHGDVQPARIGIRPSQDVYQRVKSALDPVGRFPE